MTVCGHFHTFLSAVKTGHCLNPDFLSSAATFSSPCSRAGDARGWTFGPSITLRIFYYFIVLSNCSEGAACPDQRAKNTPGNKKLISCPALSAVWGFYSPLAAGLGLELATVFNLKASVASRPLRLCFDTRHQGTNLSLMQNTIEIEEAVITRPVRINTHTRIHEHTHTHTHTPLCLTETISCSLFPLFHLHPSL